MIDSSEVDRALRIFINQDLPLALVDAMEQACLRIEADAKENCPANTGNLRQSITHQIESSPNKIQGMIGSNLEYAPYVHQGTGIYALEGNGRKNVPWTYYDVSAGEFRSTKGIEATPFLQQAIDDDKNVILDYFEGIIGQ